MSKQAKKAIKQAHSHSTNVVTSHKPKQQTSGLAIAKRFTGGFTVLALIGALGFGGAAIFQKSPNGAVGEVQSATTATNDSNTESPYVYIEEIGADLVAIRWQGDAAETITNDDGTTFTLAKSGYRLERTTDKNSGNWTIAVENASPTIPLQNEDGSWSNPPLYDLASSVLNPTGYTLKPNTTYYYRVSIQDQTGNWQPQNSTITTVKTLEKA